MEACEQWIASGGLEPQAYLTVEKLLRDEVDRQGFKLVPVGMRLSSHRRTNSSSSPITSKINLQHEAQETVSYHGHCLEEPADINKGKGIFLLSCCGTENPQTSLQIRD